MFSNKDLSIIGHPVMAGIATVPSPPSTQNEVGGGGGVFIGGLRVKRSLDVSHVYHYYREAKGRFCPCFFGTFLRTTKSSIKINFLKDNIEVFKLRHPKVGIDIFCNFFIH